MARWAVGIEIIIVMLWIGFMAQRQIAPPTATHQTSAEGLSLLEAVDSESAQWMGIYMEGVKIGASYSEEIATQTGWKRQERSYIKIRAFDQDKEITTVSTANLNREGQLQSFHFYLSAPPVRTDVSGEVVGSNLELKMLTGDTVASQTIPLKDGPPEMGLTFKKRILEADPQAGDVVSLTYFDPATLSHQVMDVEVVDRQSVQVDAQAMTTYTLKANYQGFNSQLILRSDGLTLEEEGALGMTMKAESRDEALHEGWGGRPPADIIAMSIIPVDKTLPNARESRRLRIKIKGAGVETLIQDAHERKQLFDDGELRIYIPDDSEWNAPMLPVVQPEFADYLKSTPTIQSDDVDIVRIARATVGDDLTGDLAAKHLMEFVYERLDKVPTVGIPNAKEVLKVSQGDCNEHTILYTAMARAVGLPTRMAAGIVYSEGSYGGQGFLYHAWPEVWLGQWVPVDPTFGQFPADATHIKLVEGDLDQQVALVRVVGNLSVEILEIK